MISASGSTAGSEAAWYGMIAQLDDDPILAVHRLPGGANSCIYKVITARRSRIVKVYATAQADGYDRGGTEFRALRLLWSRGFRNVPEPLGFDREHQVGVYSFEPGTARPAPEADVRDIECLADFLTAVRDATEDVKAVFPPERTACLHLRTYLDRIQQRIDAVSGRDATSAPHAEVQRFVSHEVLARFDAVRSEFIAGAEALQLPLDLPLPMENQVLVPADAGIHNMLVARGRHVFLDFEYFGRDDPCRTVLHVLHHDSHRELSPHRKGVFLRRMMARGFPPLEDDRRLRLIDPLVGLDWVMLYLNVCSSDRSGVQAPHSEGILRARLRKAREKLHSLHQFGAACR